MCVSFPRFSPVVFPYCFVKKTWSGYLPPPWGVRMKEWLVPCWCHFRQLGGALGFQGQWRRSDVFRPWYSSEHVKHVRHVKHVKHVKHCYIHVYIYIYIIVVLCLSLLLSLLLLVLNYIWLLHLWVILWRVIQSGFRRGTGGFNQQ